MEEAQELLRPRELMEQIYRPVVDAAVWERATHAYRNRTGNLNRSTRAEHIHETPNHVQVDLVMGDALAYYARYIAYDKGLSNIETAANMAEAEIASKLTRYGRKIAARG